VRFLELFGRFIGLNGDGKRFNLNVDCSDVDFRFIERIVEN
jgi:hypothetical protein